jgi:hypothetical protein
MNQHRAETSFRVRFEYGAAARPIVAGSPPGVGPPWRICGAGRCHPAAAVRHPSRARPDHRGGRRRPSGSRRPWRSGGSPPSEYVEEFGSAAASFRRGPPAWPRARVVQERLPVFWRQIIVRSQSWPRRHLSADDSGHLFHLLGSRHAPSGWAIGHAELEHNKNTRRLVPKDEP